MTTELEKQFFDTFGIEQIEYTQCNLIDCKNIYHDCNNCPFYNVYKIDYPQITDRILLELICILASNPIHILFESMLSGIKEVELLKNSILLTCIANKDTIKHQVQEIFKGDK